MSVAEEVSASNVDGNELRKMTADSLREADEPLQDELLRCLWAWLSDKSSVGELLD